MNPLKCSYVDRFGTCLRPRGTVDSCTVARCTRFYNYHNSAKTTISLLHVAQESFNSLTTITTVYGVRKVLILVKLTDCVTYLVPRLRFRRHILDLWTPTESRQKAWLIYITGRCGLDGGSIST